METKGGKRLAGLRQYLLGESQGNLESATPSGGDPASDAAIREKVERSFENISAMGRRNIVMVSSAKELANLISDNAGDAVKALFDNDEGFFLKEPTAVELLEVIVKTDGTRPSFLTASGKPDLTSDHAGAWANAFNSSEELLKKAISCVGRVDIGSVHVGSGFLVGENLLVTNRHVLETVAVQNAAKDWTVDPLATVDFGKEYRGFDTLNARRLSRVIFAGPLPILQTIDHRKLDLALVELGPGNPDLLPRQLLSIEIRHGDVETGKNIYTIGYPAKPSAYFQSLYGKLLEDIYGSLYGYKRVAPGNVISSTQVPQAGRLSHDASTLGGNSGSLVVLEGYESVAVAIHYGGTVANPRENWGHLLSDFLNATDGRGDITLKQHLDQYEVNLF